MVHGNIAMVDSLQRLYKKFLKIIFKTSWRLLKVTEKHYKYRGIHKSNKQ